MAKFITRPTTAGSSASPIASKATGWCSFPPVRTTQSTEWDFQPDGGITLHSDPTLAIDCGTVSAEQYLYLNTYKKNNASASQQWQFDPQSDDAQSGYIENVSNSQLVFDLQWRNVAKGTYIWTYTANASDAEIWAGSRPAGFVQEVT